jgi:hypothetical protein
MWIQMDMIPQDPFVGMGAHDDCADLPNEAGIAAFVVAVELEEPIERVA